MNAPTHAADSDTEHRRFHEALCRKDDAAVEQLISLHFPRLIGLARSILRHEHDAHDAVQDGLISALRNIGSLSDPAALEPWLNRIIANAALARLRSRKNRRERPIEDLLPVFHDDGHRAAPRGCWTETARDRLESDELTALVRARIEELPPAYREVIMIRDVMGLDTADAAEVLGVTTNLVKVRLHRARQALRTLLEEDLNP